jgi:type III pantothenate kinase
MILLLDIGNTNTHIGLAAASRVGRHTEVPTAEWRRGGAQKRILRFLGGRQVRGAALCSVVPLATPLAREFVERRFGFAPIELTHRNTPGLAVDYPRPETIGPDRLANAVSAHHVFGAPVVIIDFGTAVTFDVVDRRGCYVGGIIAPGLSAMTEYLHEKTALLPPIRIREVRRVIGRNTEEAMLIGAVHGYRGLIRELLGELRRELGCRRLPVVATGGYGPLIARRLPEILAVRPKLTLEGLRLVWLAARGASPVATE